MTDSIQQVLAFLGAGGQRPRCDVLCLSDDPWRMLSPLDFPEGNSVYAVAPSPQGGVFALATRGGRLCVYKTAHSEDGKVTTEMTESYQGAPALSLCWLDERLFAVTDTRGRCLLWDAANLAAMPRGMETTDGVICALCLAKDGRLVGLSSTGTLLFWNGSTAKIAKLETVPAPPFRSACVNLVHCGAQDVLAYPASDGRLVLYYPDQNRQSAMVAHDGEFYAIAEMGDDLLTAGFDDRRLVVWRGPHLRKAAEMAAEDGIVSLAALDFERKVVLAVFRSGNAEVLAIGEDKLSALSEVHGSDYRVAVGPGSECLQHAQEQSKRAEAQTLLSQAKEAIQNGSDSGFGALTNRLIELGRVRDAFDLRIAMAHVKRDIVAELQARRAAADSCSETPGDRNNLRLLAELLESAYQFGEARSAYERLASIEVDANIRDRIARLSVYEQAVNSGHFVVAVKEETHLRHIVAVASALEKYLSGWFQIAAHRQWHCGVGLRPEEIFRQCERAWNARRNKLERTAKMENLWWISNSSMRQATTVLLPNESPPFPSELALGLRVEALEGDTIISPFILINANHCEPGKPSSQHNQHLLEIYATIMNARDLLDIWYSSIWNMVQIPIRELFGKNRMARRPREITSW